MMNSVFTVRPRKKASKKNGLVGNFWPHPAGSTKSDQALKKKNLEDSIGNARSMAGKSDQKVLRNACGFFLAKMQENSTSKKTTAVY